jgi:predicted nucleic acid-binding protein
MPTRLIVDTNLLVRFFTGEPEDMAVATKRLVQKADEGSLELEVFPLIVAETIYTLESFYKIKREEVCRALLSLVESRGIKVHEKSRIIDALKRHRDFNVHFADAYLAAVAVDLQLAVASFDRDFDKFEDVRRVEPTLHD